MRLRVGARSAGGAGVTRLRGVGSLVLWPSAIGNAKRCGYSEHGLARGDTFVTSDIHKRGVRFDSTAFAW
jgi:hypothetical protein